MTLIKTIIVNNLYIGSLKLWSNMWGESSKLHWLTWILKALFKEFHEFKVM